MSNRVLAPHPRRLLTRHSVAVARIAYLSSDVVVSVQPSLATDSEFSKHLRSYFGKNVPGIVARGVPEVYRLTTDRLRLQLD